jgi:hypothetical protein
MSHAEVSARSKKSRETTSACADGVVLVKEFLLNWTNTTPSAPSKVAAPFSF